MSEVTITAIVDEQDKIDFEAICESEGFTPSAAIALFFKTVAREGQIPFDISLPSDPFYSKSNQAHLLESMA